MLYRIGLENNVEGRSMAWALDHPGCFAYGKTADLALAIMPEAIAEYAEWIDIRNAGGGWVEIDNLELALEDTWDVYSIDDDFEQAIKGHEVNAWFRHDWKPLSAQDVERGLQILTWSRADLLDTVYGLSPDQLSTKFPGERWSIAGILRHVGGADWWYLNNLGLTFPETELPDEAFTRLERVRAHLVNVLPTLSGSKQVLGVYGEFWSPRKILRRAAWHERDHTWHIRKLISMLG
jgi:hypothetical protein